MAAPKVLVLVLPLAAAGCASYSGRGLEPGVSSAADVERVMGKPAEARQLANGETLLWYPRLPYGRESFAARTGADGRLIAIEQRLTAENLYRVEPGKAGRDDVLDLLGPPYRKDWFARLEREIWTYPMKYGVGEWYLGLVQFSSDNVVREVRYIRDPDAYRGNGARAM